MTRCAVFLEELRCIGILGSKNHYGSYQPQTKNFHGAAQYIDFQITEPRAPASGSNGMMRERAFDENSNCSTRSVHTMRRHSACADSRKPSFRPRIGRRERFRSARSSESRRQRVHTG